MVIKEDLRHVLRQEIRRELTSGDPNTTERLADILAAAGGASEATVSSILARLNADLDTRASEATLSTIDSKLGNIREALASVGTDRLLTTPDNPSNLDVALSTRASESSLTSFASQAYDSVNDRYKINAEAVANPSNLDTALSTRASESTLSTVDSKLGELRESLASVGTDRLLTTPDNPSNLDIALSTRASESTLSALNAKVQSQSADLFVKDISVGTDAVQIDTDSAYRDEVIILADSGNTDTVYVGNSTNQLFPLAAGASVAIRKTALNLTYVKAASGTQSVHVISGGA